MCVEIRCDPVYYGAMTLLSFIPSPGLEKSLKALQAKIQDFAATVRTLSLDERDWLHKQALISTIGASTRIENAVLTDAEIEWVDTTLSQSDGVTDYVDQKDAIVNKLSKDRERSIEEVIGCRELLTTVYLQAAEMFPLTQTAICGLHHILLKFYPEAERYAGRYKTSPNQVVSVNHDTGERRVVLDPTPPGMQTDAAMADLLIWYNGTVKEYIWPLLTATEFVFRFLAIHPFQDGNGRLGRALFLIALTQSEDEALATVMRYTTIDRQIERHRALYYSMLQQTSDGRYKQDSGEYNLEPLALFFLKMFEYALSDVEILRVKYKNLNKLSESAAKIFAYFKNAPEKRLNIAELTEETGLNRRTVQNSINTLLKFEFIQRLGAGAGTRYQLIF